MQNATTGDLRSGDERINKECDSFDKENFNKAILSEFLTRTRRTVFIKFRRVFISDVEIIEKHCVLKYRKLASMHPSYNFLFTREPIQRLYSCWKDKIYKREGHQYYYEKANKKIFLSEGFGF